MTTLGQGPTSGRNSCDVAVIGGGAAGLSAALVLTRARRRVVVIDAGQPRNAPAAHMQGFLGSDGLPPSSLLAAGRREVAGYGGHLLDGRVTDVRPASADGAYDRPAFVVSLAEGSIWYARRVLLTTGLRDDIPDLPGVRERWGRDLLHCPYCHGYEVRDQPLGVLGGTAEALAHAHLVRQWSDDVVYFAEGQHLTPGERKQLDARAIDIVDEPVTRLTIANDRLTGVELASGRVVPRAAVFVRPQLVAHDELLTALGCAIHPNGWVVTDEAGRTSVPGVWAAGNVTNPRAQVVTAAGEGSAAAIAINNDLVEEDISTAVGSLSRERPA